MPEPQGRAFAELDLLFEERVSARKFAKTKVDIFADSSEGKGEEAVGAHHMEKM